VKLRTFFYVFFKIQKTWLFTFFWVADHVFSNTASVRHSPALYQNYSSYERVVFTAG